MDKISGTCEPGYEQVRDAYATLVKSGDDTRSQVCVWVGDKCVVDLQVGMAAEDHTTLFSSSKNVAAILFGTLHDQGKFQYSDPVCKYWPEFAQHGKEKITIEDVMKHEAGLVRLCRAITSDDLTPERIKQNTVGKLIEDSTTCWPFEAEGSKREYHAGSRDWIANEIFRRLEPNGYTFGDYLNKVFREQTGVQSLYCGATPEQMQNYKELKVYGAFKMFRQMWGGPDKHFVSFNLSGGGTFNDACSNFDKHRNAHVEKKGLDKFYRTDGGQEIYRKKVGPKDEGFFMSRDLPTGIEIPSANMVASARAIAKISAIMANKGQMGDCKIMSPETWETLHANPTKDYMGGPMLPSSLFTTGGFFKYDTIEETDPFCIVQGKQHIEGREGFYGWYGFAGSVMMWHPELKMGFAYVPCDYNPVDQWALRGKFLQQAAVRSARGQGKPIAGSSSSSTCNIF